ncbi:MAG: NUDIX domain-containing protein [Hymenobacteraceae bacterium]|nr:NUDIX domain-containing protein [Hymenobacteraceae bacterium]
MSSDSFLAPYTGRIRVRVGGLLLNAPGVAVLLAGHRGLLPDGAVFWSPPGGGWQFGESLAEAVAREFREETGLLVAVGELLRVHEFRTVAPATTAPAPTGLQAVELFFGVTAADSAARPHLGHDPEHAPGEQLLIGLHWLTPAAWRALPAAQVHPVVRAAATTADLLTARAGLG